MVAVVCIVVALGLYLFNFNNGFGDQEAFARFGDFFGGTLNPLLTFLTIVLLIWSINVQLHELKLTRKEMEDTRKELAQSAAAQTQSYELQLSDLKYRQIEKRIQTLYIEFNNAWNRPFFPSISRSTGKVSLYHAFEESSDERDPNLRDLRQQARNMHKDIITDYNIKNVLNDMSHMVLVIAELTADSFNYTFSSSVAAYEHFRAKKLLDKMNKFGLITGEEFERAMDIIKLPGHLHPDILDRD